MNTTDKLKEIASRCKASISLQINNHRDYYETAEDSIKNNEEMDDVSEEVLKEMIASNTIIRLQFYPNTPVGSFTVYHYDLDKALALGIELLNQES